MWFMCISILYFHDVCNKYSKQYQAHVLKRYIQNILIFSLLQSFKFKLSVYCSRCVVANQQLVALD